MAIVGDITSNELKDYYYIPPSTIFPYAGTAVTTPDGWLFCDGSSYGTATYPDLFSVIGYSYGGSGTAFAVPDLRGRVIAGRDMDNGSGTAGRLSTITNQGTALAISAGAQTHTLGTAEMPVHHHGTSSLLSGTTNLVGGHQHSGNVNPTNTDHTHTNILQGTSGTNFDAVYLRNQNGVVWLRIYNADTPGTGYTAVKGGANSISTIQIGGMNSNQSHDHSYTTNEMGAHTHTVTGNVVSGTAGGGSAHNNLQPTIVLNYIIKV